MAKRKEMAGAPVKLTVENVENILGLLIMGNSVETIANAYNVHQSMIIKVKQGKGRFLYLHGTETYEKMCKALGDCKSLKVKDGRSGSHKGLSANDKRLNPKYTGSLPEDITEILELLEVATQLEVSELYNVSPVSVSRAVSGHPDYAAKHGRHTRSTSKQKEVAIIEEQELKIPGISEAVEALKALEAIDVEIVDTMEINLYIGINTQKVLEEILPKTTLFRESISKVTSMFSPVGDCTIEEANHIIGRRAIKILEEILHISDMEHQRVYIEIQSVIKAL